MRTDSRSSRSERSALVRVTKAAGLFAVPMILAAVPLSTLEKAPSVCLARRLGIPCWGCGMTRAVASVLRFDWRRAWRYNPRVVVVAPILAYLWAREIRRV